MVGKALRGLGIAAFILLGGLYYSRDLTEFRIVLAAIVTTIGVIIVIDRFISGSTNEVFVTGFLLTVVESYVFLIQPNYPGLPEIPGSAKLFFGVAAITRIAIFMLEKINNPLQARVKRLLRG